MPPYDDSISFTIPARIHPGYSLLGRALRREFGDPLRAEAHHILALAALGLLPVAVHYLGDFVPLPIDQWPLQAGILLLIVLTGVAGWQPRTDVEVRDGSLSARRGKEMWSSPLDEIESAETISALRYHRHYRRYSVTRAFIGRMEQHLVLLRTRRGPVVLGLGERDRAAFLHYLENRRSVHAA